jgi:hypothetical protein
MRFEIKYYQLIKENLIKFSVLSGLKAGFNDNPNKALINAN